MSRAKPKPRGRPILGAEPRKRYLVTLEPAVAQRLREYGLGNLSAGITRAAAPCPLCGNPDNHTHATSAAAP